MGLRIEFIVNIYKELKQNQLDSVTNKELRQFANIIRRFLRNQDEKIESNQAGIRMKYIFRGMIFKAQMGSNFRITKDTKLNRIIIKHCMNFYVECWQDKNLKLHNKEEQHKIEIEQYENKK